MAFRLHVVEYVTHSTVGANNEGRAGDPFDLLAVHVLFLDNAKFVADFLIGVAQKGVGQIIFSLKFLLGFWIIGRDAQDRGAGALKLLIRFAEPASFNGSAGSIGFGKEKQHHRFSAELFQRDWVSVLVGQSKLRSFIINVHG